MRSATCIVRTSGPRTIPTAFLAAASPTGREQYGWAVRWSMNSPVEMLSTNFLRMNPFAQTAYMRTLTYFFGNAARWPSEQSIPRLLGLTAFKVSPLVCRRRISRNPRRRLYWWTSHRRNGQCPLRGRDGYIAVRVRGTVILEVKRGPIEVHDFFRREGLARNGRQRRRW